MSHEAKEQMKHNRHSKEKGAQAEEKFLADGVEKIWKQGMSPKEAMGVSNSYLEGVYAQAYRLYNTGKYAEAVHLFRMLVMLNAMEPKYMMGLAACFHMLKDFSNAIQNYTIASVLDPGNPIPHYHCSDCSIQMKEYLSAMLYLELTLERCGEKPEFAKMKERAQLSLESLKKQTLHTPSDENHRSSKKD